MHMGMVHMKVNSILIEKGFEPIIKNRSRKANTKENDSDETSENIENEESTESMFVESTESISESIDEEFTQEISSESIDEKCTQETSSESIDDHSCTICKQQTQSIEDLWNHYKSSHYSKSPKESHVQFSSGLLCKFCSKTFVDDNTLFMHIGVCYNLL